MKSSVLGYILFLVIKSGEASSTVQNRTFIISCESSFDCSDNGECNTQTGNCSCMESFDTFTELSSSSSAPSFQCNYEKKEQLTAFLLSLFLGIFGAEHFYLGNTDRGITKLCFSLFCFIGNIIIFSISRCCGKDKQYLIEFVGRYEAIYLGCGFVFMLLWFIQDLILIGTLGISDANGISLKSW